MFLKKITTRIGFIYILILMFNVLYACKQLHKKSEENKLQSKGTKNEAVKINQESLRLSNEPKALLNKGFGIYTEIQGKITNINSILYQNKNLIEINRINNKRLDKPIVMIFNSWVGLFEPEIPATGSFVKMKGFESGKFIGVPKDISPGSHNFGFHFQHTFEANEIQTIK